MYTFIHGERKGDSRLRNTSAGITASHRFLTDLDFGSTTPPAHWTYPDSVDRQVLQFLQLLVPPRHLHSDSPGSFRGT